MNNPTPERLIFWPFFRRIEKELSYERWIEKYLLFQTAITGQHIAYDDDWSSFRTFCKILYLQDHRDEIKFDTILTEAIEQEKLELLKYLAQNKQASKPFSSKTGDDAVDKTVNEIKPKAPVLAPNKKKSADPISEDKQEEAISKTHITKYFQPHLEDISFVPDQNDDKKNTPRVFLQTDEYFPVSRRQMAKAWQYLRRKERRGFSSQLNIPATVRQIANNGLLIEPVFYPGMVNSLDTLIIYSDCRGSMTPFHEFSRRLIQTARTEGGHPNAPIYYFQNYPQGYIYRRPNLTEPLKVKESLLHANRNHTMVIIISDAGAAKGNNDEERIAIRKEMTEHFLDQLKNKVAHVIWLNPIPEHRWPETAANEIRQMVTVMAPIFDERGPDFQSIIRLLLRHKYPNA